MAIELQLFLMEWSAILWSLLILGMICFIIGFAKFFLGIGYYNRLRKQQDIREKAMLSELAEYVKKLKAEKTE